MMTNKAESNDILAAALTKASGQQTYLTIRLLADRGLVTDAYRAYAYFRWVDDYLDGGALGKTECAAFLGRQQSLAESCYRGEWPHDLLVEECMLVDLIRNDRQENSGLQSYIRNMMAVMAFDADRRGRLISQQELGEYARLLATAVTDALHHFIGNTCVPSTSEARYLAATGAHIAHMLRDTRDDNASGYFNIPREFLDAHRISPLDVESEPYRDWVRNRVQLARSCFKAGKRYLAQVENPRCRIAGWAYIASFEGVLEVIEQDDYLLRSDYGECKNLGARMRMFWSVLSQAIGARQKGTVVPVLRA